MPSITFPSGSILVPTVLVSAVLDLSADMTSVYSTISSNSASWAGGGDWDTILNKPTEFNPTSHFHHASSINAGVLDPARIPVINTSIQIISPGGLADLTTEQQDQIVVGAIVTTTDGQRYVYVGGDKTSPGSYIALADITPDWTVISNKPLEFNPSSHTHEISAIQGLEPVVTWVTENSASNNQLGNEAYAIITANSATWETIPDVSLGNSAYTLITNNSATWETIPDVSLGNEAYTLITNNSATWETIPDVSLGNEAYTIITANSSLWETGGAAVEEEDKIKWDSTFNTVSSLSADWNTTYSSVKTNSGSWNDAYTSLNTNSSNWDNAYSSITSNSGNWDNIYSYVRDTSSNIDNISTSIGTNSSNWDSAYTTVNTTSSRWDSAYATLNEVSASFGDSLTWVENNSSSMYVDRLGVYTDIELLPPNLKLAVQGDTVIYGNLSSLGTTTLVNVTANVVDALSVVNPGFGSPHAIYIEQGGPAAGVRLQNNGSGPMMVLQGNGNVGIGTSTPGSKLTVVGAISSNDIIYSLGGSSDIWNSTYSTTNTNSASWGASNTLMAVNSAKWNNAYNTLSSNSGSWSSSYTTLNANSSTWNNVYNTVNSTSSNWNNSYNNLNANSAVWNNSSSVLAANSSNWNNSYNTFSSNSAKYESSTQNMQQLSGNWQRSYSTTNALSAMWSSASINYIIDGSGAAVTTGSKGVIYLPTGFRVQSWRVMAETTTTAKLDVRRFPNNAYKLGSLSGDSLLIDKINPTQINWLTLNDSASAVGNGSIFADISALDTLEFYVEENTVARRFTVSLAGLRTL